MNKILIIIVLLFLNCSRNSYEHRIIYQTNTICQDTIIYPDQKKSSFRVTYKIKGNQTEDSYLLFMNSTKSHIYDSIHIKKGDIDMAILRDWYDEPMVIRYSTVSHMNEGEIEVYVDFSYM